MGPADQRDSESEPVVLVYTADPLASDVDIVGDVSLRLFAASTATDTDFVARLCVVDRYRVSRNIEEGIVRASYRESGANPSPIRPGTSTSTSWTWVLLRSECTAESASDLTSRAPISLSGTGI